MKTKIVGILVCMLLIATALPAVGTMNKIKHPIIVLSHDFNTEIKKVNDILNSNGDVLWDNGMHYQGCIESQWDATYQWESLGADDFQFEETTIVTEVYWIGGYYLSGGDFDCDWNVSFYMDQGNGNEPGNKIYEEVFPNAMVHETYIEEMWDAWMFSYWVELADPITFTGGEKYWISIQGLSFPNTNTMWGFHQPVVEHVLVHRCPNAGYPDWTDCTELWYGNALDFCFQLAGDGEPVVPDLDCDGDLSWNEVSPGTVVNSTFMVINDGDVGSMLGWEVQEFPDWGTNWSTKWIHLDWIVQEDGGYVGTTQSEEIFVEVIAPEEENEEFTGEIVLVNVDDPDDTCTIPVTLITPCETAVSMHPLFQKILERFPNTFPVIRTIFGL